VLTLTANQSTLFAGTFSGGIYSSANNGATWKSANKGLSVNTVLSLRAFGDNLFAGTDFNGVFMSRNNGTSWAAFNSGLPDNTAVLCLCMSDSTLFAGLYGNGVWRRSIVNPALSPATSVALEKTSTIGEVIVSATPGGLHYTLPEAGHVSIKYYNLEGKLLASMVNHSQAAGNYSQALPPLPEGIYVQDFRAGSFTQVDRLRILR